MKLHIWLVIKNIVAIICFSGLAIYFNKWWIALFGLLFLTLFEGEDK